MADLSELQGEVLAFRCFLAALVSALPLSVQMRVMPAFEVQASQLRRTMSTEHRIGFDRASGAVRAKRLCSGPSLGK